MGRKTFHFISSIFRLIMIHNIIVFHIIERISDERTVSPLDYEIYSKPTLLPNNSLDNGGASQVAFNSAAGKTTGVLMDTVASSTNAASSGSGNATTISQMVTTQATDEQQTTSGNGLSGGGATAADHQEVDEDGYSIQPPKEIILEANGNKDGKDDSDFLRERYHIPVYLS